MFNQESLTQNKSWLYGPSSIRVGRDIERGPV